MNKMFNPTNDFEFVESEDENNGKQRTFRADTEILDVDISKLFADHTYARITRPLKVRRMARTFDSRIVSIPKVSRRENGMYAILDGQHRINAIRANNEKLSVKKNFDDLENYEEVPFMIRVEVHNNLSLDEESDIYTKFNVERTKLSPIEVYIGQLGAGYPATVGISKILDKHEITVGNASKKQCHLTCVSTLEKYYGINPALLDWTFWILDRAWGNKSPEPDFAYNAETIPSVFHLLSCCFMTEGITIVIPKNLNRYLDDKHIGQSVSQSGNELNLGHLIKKMREVNSHKLRQQIRMARDNGYATYAGGLNFVGSEFLLKWYNAKISTGNRIECSIPSTVTWKTLKITAEISEADFVIDRRT